MPSIRYIVSLIWRSINPSARLKRIELGLKRKTQVEGVCSNVINATAHNASINECKLQISEVNCVHFHSKAPAVGQNLEEKNYLKLNIKCNHSSPISQC